MRHIDQIRMRAKELARTGIHADCLAIERQLAEEGYEERRPGSSGPFHKGAYQETLRQILARFSVTATPVAHPLARLGAANVLG